jgi:hypothetical protein
MKHIPKSQETEFSQHTATADADEPYTFVGVRPMENPKEESSVDVDFDAKVSGQVKTDASGKNVLIRDKDASDDTSELRLLDESSLSDSESDEFDPYNSGSFDMSKSRLWKSGS